MRGVKFLGNSKVEVTKLDDPEPGDGEVLVKVGVSAICGSEMGRYRSPEPLDGNPGHEVMGVVYDTNGSRKVKEGDRVGVSTIQGCGNCFWCLQGKPDFCREAQGLNNTHSEYVVSKDIWLHHLADDIDDATGVLLSGDGLGVPYGASMRSGTKAGDVNCVFGVGPVGLGFVLVQTFLGAQIVAVDMNTHRLELAKGLGAWKAINPNEVDNLRDVLLDLTGGLGPDRCFECCGQQETLDMALDITKPEGIVMIIGSGKQTMDPQRLIYHKNLRVMGNWVCHFSDYAGMLNMVRNGLQVTRIITNQFPLEEANEAYHRFSSGLEGKVLLIQ